MKKVLITLVAIAACWVAVASFRLGKAQDELNELRENKSTMLWQIDEYRTRDSMLTAEVGLLNLSLDDYKRYREEDAKIIQDLRQRNHDLASVAKTQTETIIDLQGKVRDTIINITDTLYCIEVKNRWYELSGCADKGMNWKGKLSYRDELIIFEQIQYKRFLGFLWKTNKVKHRSMKVVSKNPYTKKIDFEFVEIKE